MALYPGRHQPRANHLLAAMPVHLLERLIPQMEMIRPEIGDVLVRADEPVERVCFPTGGVFSLLLRDYDGQSVEAAVTGREGMLGTAAVLGAPVSIFEESCQVEDAVLALPVGALRAELQNEPALRALLLCYVAGVLHATARSVCCNRLHTTEQRLARWLVQVRDRVESDTFFLTQEFLAEVLGVRRPTVTDAVGALEGRGLIRHQRGRIRLLDDAGLEAAACEDYRRVRDSYARLMAR